MSNRHNTVRVLDFKIQGSPTEVFKRVSCIRGLKHIFEKSLQIGSVEEPGRVSPLYCTWISDFGASTICRFSTYAGDI